VIFPKWCIIKQKWGIVDNYGDKYPILGINKMLLGEFQHVLDTKGRVAVPARFREKINSGAIITRGLDRCLFIFGMKEWEILVQKLVALPLAQANSRAFVRLMLAGASDVQLDSQGRILIPDYLRSYANLKKKVMVAGLYNRMEVWDSGEWSKYKSKTESASDEIAEKLGELGI
jgi:MraZ protein